MKASLPFMKISGASEPARFWRIQLMMSYDAFIGNIHKLSKEPINLYCDFSMSKAPSPTDVAAAAASAETHKLDAGHRT